MIEIVGWVPCLRPQERAGRPANHATLTYEIMYFHTKTTPRVTKCNIYIVTDILPANSSLP